MQPQYSRSFTEEFNAASSIEEIFNLAYWMTGEEATAGMIVGNVYQVLHENATKVELYQAFRETYLGMFGQTLAKPEVITQDESEIEKALLSLPTDFKMIVLFADIAGLSHQEISEVVEKPVDVVRGWLNWGRKLLASELATVKN
ncbi:MAG: sigma factor-like helix-turn-helix DNA-binding protein [Chloroherpetonaceae bacterium]|nr:sigma factor-like helix-turn-helix DNA-binding protein [Chloroherpetonaceae bacterium]